MPHAGHGIIPAAMPSEHIQSRIASLLDQADKAIEAGGWELARQRAQGDLRFGPENVDALAYLNAAERDASPDAPSSSPDAAGVGADSDMIRLHF